MQVSIPRYTVEDLGRFPDDGGRYDLLDGMLLVTPAPTAAHQRVATRLLSLLYEGVERRGLGSVVGPGAITAPPRTQLQPDVLVYPPRFGPAMGWEEVTEHWVAAEIFSASSRVYDREFKRAAYFALRVQQVWLVDLDDRSVDVWTSAATHEVVRDVIRWRVPGQDLVVEIPLAELFAGFA